MIHLGADLLPKNSSIFEAQKKFINGYLKTWYARCKEKGIEVLAFFGNDDIYTRKKYFKKYGTLLDEAPVLIDGYEFKAYPYVQDYPFGLKTACKWDSANWRCPEEYIHEPRDVGDNGWIEILDSEKYFREKGTIEDDLKNILVTNKTIMAIHQPPSGLLLDVCMDGRRVGSPAVYNWIRKEQPLLVLCGHIHENYFKTRMWELTLGSTRVIQPGQCFPRECKTRAILITIEEKKVRTELLELSHASINFNNHFNNPLI